MITYTAVFYLTMFGLIAFLLVKLYDRIEWN
jgi:hypothetical protein